MHADSSGWRSALKLPVRTGVVLIVAVSIAACSQDGSVVADHSTYTVNVDNWVWAALILFWLGMGIAMIVSAIKALRNGGHRANWLLIPAGALMIGLVVWGWSTYPIETDITVDAQDRAIVVEKQFLIGANSTETYPFSDLSRVRYRYLPPRGEDRASGRVILVLTSGRQMEIYHASPQRAADLAVAIGSFSGRPVSKD